MAISEKRMICDECKHEDYYNLVTCVRCGYKLREDRPLTEGKIKHGGNNPPPTKPKPDNPPPAQSPSSTEAPTVELVLCGGVEGPSVYLHDYRIWGNKPWGGATTQKVRKIRLDELEVALELKEGSLDHLIKKKEDE